MATDTVLYYTTCLKIDRTDGVVFGFTEMDVDVTISQWDPTQQAVVSLVYKSMDSYQPTAIQSKTSAAVSNADIQGILSLGGVDKSDIQRGLFDHARLTFFIYDWLSQSIVQTQLTGFWGEAQIEGGRYVAEFRSLLQTLQQPIGRTYTVECDAEFGDSRCSFDKSTVTLTGIITSVTDQSVFSDSTRLEAIDYFNYGVITFTSGDNSGLSMEIEAFSSTQFTTFLGFPYPVLVGDTYSAYAGCNKKLATCRDKFNNIVNFRGFPFIPGRDELLKFGQRSE